MQMSATSALVNQTTPPQNVSSELTENVILERILTDPTNGFFEMLGLIRTTRIYVYSMTAVVLLSVVLSLVLNAVLLYLQFGSVDPETKKSFSNLFWSFDMVWLEDSALLDDDYKHFLMKKRYMPVTFAFAFPLLLAILGDTLVHFLLGMKQDTAPDDTSLLRSNSQPKSTFTSARLMEFTSAAMDILELFALLSSSRALLLDAQSMRSWPIVFILVLAPVLRCSRFIRLYQSHRRGRATNWQYPPTAENEQEIDAIEVPEKRWRYFHRDSLANELVPPEQKSLQAYRQMEAEKNLPLTLSIRLQLRLLRRLSLVEQEDTLNRFGHKFMRGVCACGCRYVLWLLVSCMFLDNCFRLTVWHRLSMHDFLALQ